MTVYVISILKQWIDRASALAKWVHAKVLAVHNRRASRREVDLADAGFIPATCEGVTA